MLPKDDVRVDFIDKFLVSIKYRSDLCYDSNGYQSHSQYTSVSHGSSYYRTMTYYADHPCHAGICNSWQRATHVTRTNEVLGAYSFLLLSGPGYQLRLFSYTCLYRCPSKHREFEMNVNSDNFACYNSCFVYKKRKTEHSASLLRFTIFLIQLSPHQL